MSDFHTHLIAVARKMGAQDVRLERKGRPEEGRFRDHPHIAGTVEGKPFRFPVPARPYDGASNYRANYVTALRRLLSAMGAEPPPCEAAAPRQGLHRQRKRPQPQACASAAAPRPGTGSAPTRLDRDPWAPLAALRQRKPEGKDAGGTA